MKQNQSLDKKFKQTLNFLSIILFLMISQNISAQSISDKKQEQIEQITQSMLESFPGVSIAIGRDSTILWSGAMGYSEINRHKAEPTTKFRVYSISKLWTSAAAALLAEQGKLDLNAEVQKYVPDFPRKKYAITPLQLAYHSSGIRHYKGDLEVYSQQHCRSVEEALQIFKDDSLLFEPGSQKLYSSWGYVLLSAVIEGAAGKSYTEVMNEIFKSADMESTMHYPENPGEDIAHSYERNEGGNYQVVSNADPSCKWGAGGFISTASDIVRFNLTLLQGKIVSSDFVKLLISPDSNGTHYFGGSSAGGRSMVRTDVNTGFVIAILGNARANDVDLRQITDSIANIIARND